MSKQLDVSLDEVVRLAGLRRTIGEVAAALGCSRDTIKRRVRQAGLSRVFPKSPRPERNGFWRGGRTVDPDGYVLLKRPDHPYATKGGYVREHRLVMEQQLGRYLLPEERVHHKQAPRSNNDPSNLVLFGSNAEHLRHELTGRPYRVSAAGRAKLRQPKTAEHRRKIGDAHRGRRLSEAQREQLRRPRGPLSPEHLERLRQGYRRALEQRRAASRAASGSGAPPSR